jgi:F-type H+-transporting ATPase subunit a
MNPSAFSNLEKSRRPIAAWLILSLCMLFAFACAAAKAEDKHTGAAPAAEASGHGAEHAEAHHGISPEAPTFGDRSKGAWVNSSMIVTWIVALLIIGFAQYATRKIRGPKAAALEPPSGAQNFLEFLVEGLQSFLEEMIGPDLARKTFWFFATIFIFILGVNWFGLLPGVGTIGWGVPKDPSAPHFLEHVAVPLMRGGHADLNMTFALSSIFFVLWVYWAVQANGVIGVVKHLFAPKGDSKGAMKVMMIAVFLFVGVLEIISISFRPVSLSFRLYGNIFAGENLLESMQGLVPALGWLIPVPFYFMELLVGIVQALVFMLLTAVFTLLICTHDEEHAEHAEGHAPH